MKHILILILLVGCKSYQGEMNVTDHLIYKNTKGKTQVLVIGDYTTKVKVNKKKSITIKAKNIFEDVKIKLNLPKSINNFLSSDDSTSTTRIDLPKNITGQPFSVQGELKIETTAGEPITETQSCSNSPRWDIDCGWQYEDVIPGRPGYGPNTWCNSIPLGTRDVTYRLDQITSTVRLELSNDETPNAFINASSVKEEKVLLTVSKCEY